jgi:glutamyl-tRNA reductase
MSVLVVGLSHRTAPIGLLERASMSAREATDLALALCRGGHVLEAVCLVTCNRLEVYAEVSKFHGGVGEVGTALAQAIGISLEELTEHLYAHYEGAAVSHLFSVASGLDSMAVGEAQILGQVRSSLRAGQAAGSAGRAIGHLLQAALRVGKRAHTQTRLDQAAPSLVEAGLSRAAGVLGAVQGAGVLVIGAGAMSGLSVATASRAGAGSITVSSRTHARAERLAASVNGIAVPAEELPGALAGADIVIASAGAAGYLVDADAAAAALAARDGRPQVYIDLAVPRDIDPAIALLPGAHVVDLEVLGRDLSQSGLADDVAQARELVAEEVTAYLAGQRAQAVAPTVVALRSMARSVVDAELARLESRLGGVDAAVRAELEQTVHRVVEKLLHAPTVRMKELAAEPGGSSYAEALRTLFDLGPEPEDADVQFGLAGLAEPGIEIAMTMPRPSGRMP